MNMNKGKKMKSKKKTKIMNMIMRMTMIMKMMMENNLKKKMMKIIMKRSDPIINFIFYIQLNIYLIFAMIFLFFKNKFKII